MPPSFADEPPEIPGDSGAEAAWSALLAAARQARRSGAEDQGERAYGFDPAHGLRRVSPNDRDAWLLRRPDTGWLPAAEVPPGVRALLDLYLPVCNASADRPLTVGHLGQSLDGFIATSTGDSHYVTGPANILHLHRMRALCDAVVVGAETVLADDPQLTARLAAGPSPVRVVLDPQRRLAGSHGVFSDGQAPTLLVCSEERVANGVRSVGQAEVVGVPCAGGQLALDKVLNILHERGMCFVFVEGGGTTVSHFLQAGLLDRLQVAVAALVIGAGRPGLRLFPRPRLNDCLRPAHRIFAMGADVLFDCDLRSAPADPDPSVLTRIV